MYESANDDLLAPVIRGHVEIQASVREWPPRWAGRARPGRKGIRYRYIQRWYRRRGESWFIGLVLGLSKDEDEMFDGPSVRDEQERILHRIKTVDDTSDDWRAA